MFALWNLSPIASSCARSVWSEVKSLSRVRLFATPWTIAYQAPPSMGFSRQDCWSGLPFPSPGDLPDPGIEPGSPTLQADALPSEPPGSLFPFNVDQGILFLSHPTPVCSSPVGTQASTDLIVSGFLSAFFCSVQLLSRVQLFVTPWTAARQASLSITKSRSLPRLMSFKSVMPSNHLILCRPFSSRLQSFPASGSFPMSQFFASGD